MAAYGRAVAIVTSLALVGSLIACGVFLLIISLIGLVGAAKHHQVLLFFVSLSAGEIGVSDCHCDYLTKPGQTLSERNGDQVAGGKIDRQTGCVCGVGGGGGRVSWRGNQRQTEAKSQKGGHWRRF